MTRRVVLAGLFLAVSGCLSDPVPDGAPTPGLSVSAEQALLTELAWIAPGADKLRILTQSPGECLRSPTKSEDAYLVEVGRAAFSSPLLFGGQAARGGLSCASCHRDGHDNPAFFLAGLSGAPGTADVTSSLFSKVREDGVFNPVPIPSLVGIAGKDAFGAHAPAPSLNAFIASAVTDEFQGAPPPDIVLRGLEAYVARLDPAACSGAAPRNVRRDMADAARALTAVGQALQRGDEAAADFLLVSAQSALGRIHERFAGPDLAPQREGLESLAGKLAAARSALSGDAVSTANQIESAIAAMDLVRSDLNAHRRLSLYDIDRLEAALKTIGEVKE